MRGKVRDLTRSTVPVTFSGTGAAPLVFPCCIARVEVCLDIAERENSVLGWWASTPSRVTCGPVIEHQGTRDVRGITVEGILELLKQLTVGEEDNSLWRPVKPVFMVAIIRLER